MHARFLALAAMSLLVVTLYVVPTAATLLPTGAASEHLGISAVLAGDLNGDGHDDFALGATTFEAAGANVPGSVHIYFGGPALDAVSDLTLVGEAAGDRFGYFTAPAGDFNADGFADLLVGAYQNDAMGSNSGRAYVYFGGPSLDAVADIVLDAENAGDQLGVSVAGVGDVNDDGHDDLLVGARFNGASGFQAGRAYVYFGGPGADGVADVVVPGNRVGERMGFSVSRAGDVNGDGSNDFLVGAYHNGFVDFETGRAYVYFGGANVDGAPDIILDSHGWRAHFSDALEGVDVNGDGFSDILVGASQFNSAQGQAYVYWGGPGLDDVPDLVLSEGGLGDWFGRFISGGGDLNQDGFADFVVGSPANNSGAVGRAWVYHGGPGVDAEPDGFFLGAAGFDLFGWQVANPGSDVDGDGTDDLLVGAFQNDAGGANSGRAYLYVPAPPSCANARASIESLWPANGRFVAVRLAGIVGPDGAPAPYTIVSVTSDEGTGRNCPNALVSGETVQLRAARDPRGNGRVYRVAFEATNADGSCAGSVDVCVRRMQDSECIDDGQLFDATACDANADPPTREGGGVVISPTASGRFEVQFITRDEGLVDVSVYDVRGRLVEKLMRGVQPAGRHIVPWESDIALRQAAGVYLVRVTFDGRTWMRKAVQLR